MEDTRHTKPDLRAKTFWLRALFFESMLTDILNMPKKVIHLISKTGLNMAKLVKFIWFAHHLFSRFCLIDGRCECSIKYM